MAGAVNVKKDLWNVPQVFLFWDYLQLSTNARNMAAPEGWDFRYSGCHCTASRKG